ncbi:hypothetical protein [Microbulbifer sp. YPW1]|uniref:hypothetical protein n=1 Tax=Microbulbifer sp. YPW1 TaxID=2745199 RepID=UPI00159B50DF|nr:hypothetical protein [Microbulbifer sp. YPW1]QKX15787.1 hypothetical protein HUW35_01545 [Microbulbifer sp. YPW1]
MSIFEYVISFLLVVVALALTTMLGDLVRAFRQREYRPMHWLTFVWVMLVLAWQYQLLWAAFELHQIQREWTALEFGLLVGLTLVLCVAGRLIVPESSSESLATSGDGLRVENRGDAFHRFLFNGRWALACLAVYFIIGYFINVLLFDIGYFDPTNVEDLVLAALLLILICSRSETTWIVGTGLFIVASAVAILVLTPMRYGTPGYFGG